MSDDNTHQFDFEDDTGTDPPNLDYHQVPHSGNGHRVVERPADLVTATLPLRAEQIIADPDRLVRVAAMEARLVDHDKLHLIPKLPWLIQDVFHANTVNHIVGAPNVGKSFLAMDLACCVSTGAPWRGHATEAGQVVYLVAEGLNDMQARKEAWETGNGRPAGLLTFYPDVVQILDKKALEPSQEWKDFIEVCVRKQAILIIVDTQARCTLGIDENSNTEFGVVGQALEDLRLATSACVVLIHHTTKGTLNPRGAGSLEAITDARLGVVSERGTIRSAPPLVKVSCERHKTAPFFETKDFHLLPLGESAVLVDGKPEWKGRTPGVSISIPGDDDGFGFGSPDLVKLMEAFLPGQKFTRAEAALVLGRSVPTIHRYLTPLVEDEELRTSGSTTSKVYWIPDSVTGGIPGSVDSHQSGDASGDDDASPFDL